MAKQGTKPDGQRGIFLLAGNPGTAEATAQIFAQRYPGLKIVGVDCLAPGFEKDPQRLAELQAKLERAAPDVVFLALGSPKREHVIERMQGCLLRAWWLGVGISFSFSFVTGDVQRAPPWMQQLGLEWFFRTVQEPRRLFCRFFVDGLPFAAWLLARSAVSGLKRRSGR